MPRSSLISRLRGAVGPAVGDAGGEGTAAVLVLADPAQEGLPLLFIRRSQNVPTHRGQIAFPGGGFHREDADADGTALREAREEMGIQPADVEILGRLPAVSTATSARRLIPVLAVARRTPPMTPDPFEVADWFWLRLDRLLSTRPTSRRLPVVPEVLVHFYELDGRVIWGATAAILHDLLDRLGG